MYSGRGLHTTLTGIYVRVLVSHGFPACGCNDPVSLMAESDCVYLPFGI